MAAVMVVIMSRGRRDNDDGFYCLIGWHGKIKPGARHDQPNHNRLVAVVETELVGTCGSLLLPTWVLCPVAYRRTVLCTLLTLAV